MPRSVSKNKTLAVGEKVHEEITRIQSHLSLKNHDETLKTLLELLKTHNLI
jgi:hypothetical protein